MPGPLAGPPARRRGGRRRRRGGVRRRNRRFGVRGQTGGRQLAGVEHGVRRHAVLLRERDAERAHGGFPGADATHERLRRRVQGEQGVLPAPVERADGGRAAVGERGGFPGTGRTRLGVRRGVPGRHGGRLAFDRGERAGRHAAGRRAQVLRARPRRKIPRAAELCRARGAARGGGDGRVKRGGVGVPGFVPGGREGVREGGQGGESDGDVLRPEAVRRGQGVGGGTRRRRGRRGRRRGAGVCAPAGGVGGGGFRLRRRRGDVRAGEAVGQSRRAARADGQQGQAGGGDARARGGRRRDPARVRGALCALGGCHARARGVQQARRPRGFARAVRAVRALGRRVRGGPALSFAGGPGVPALRGMAGGPRPLRRGARRVPARGQSRALAAHAGAAHAQRRARAPVPRRRVLLLAHVGRDRGRSEGEEARGAFGRRARRPGAVPGVQGPLGDLLRVPSRAPRDGRAVPHVDAEHAPERRAIPVGQVRVARRDSSGRELGVRPDHARHARRDAARAQVGAFRVR
mmetsp:Transcript_7646/g.32474  ORF Transcript_7646/g.32474 Transcript_7646/m.32474 type:complete len:520 (-) Transcript_7646:902-2461(-)